MKYRILTFLLFISLSSCSTQKKIKNIERQQIIAGISLPNEDPNDLKHTNTSEQSSDTLTITDPEGNRLFLMKAIKDEKTGKMIATESLQAAVVTARFRNIAERNGKIELAFDITVPKSMQNKAWQIRFYPTLIVLGDSINLDHIHITGKDFRKTQLRGYQEYNRFLSSIITDSAHFQYQKLIQVFIERNIPELAKLKTDTSFVLYDEFKSIYDVSHDEVKEYYAKRFLEKRNNRKKKNLNKKFHKHVKSPIIQKGVRIDSIVRGDTDITYCYSQALNTRPKLKKIGFHLHRKGMIKDTIHSTALDTVYLKGVEALSNRNYKKAITYLKAYSDINTAVAYLSLDYNASALNILKDLPRSDKRDYMPALVYSRQGKEKQAIEHYMHSVEQNHSMTHRASLDPEIANLIRKYKIKTNTL